MIKQILFVMVTCVYLCGTVFAEEDTYNGPYDDADTPYTNNLGPLGTDTTVANIASESGGANGTEPGEITIYNTDSGIKVYSGVNKVEMIPSGSDGWTGSYSIEIDKINFQPTGRPTLECPAQETAGWYGPCKVPAVAE